MKRIALALLAAAGLAATTARADRVTVNGSINIGSSYGAPGYYRPAPPAYYAPARGYWKDVFVDVWIPGCWVVRQDRWGRRYSVWEPGHHERRVQRVWVEGYGHHDRRHDRHDRYDRYDRHDRRWNG